MVKIRFGLGGLQNNPAIVFVWTNQTYLHIYLRYSVASRGGVCLLEARMVVLAWVEYQGAITNINISNARDCSPREVLKRQTSLPGRRCQIYANKEELCLKGVTTDSPDSRPQSIIEYMLIVAILLPVSDIVCAFLTSGITDSV